MHLDSDDKYYYVTLDMKESGKEEISEHEFEMRCWHRVFDMKFIIRPKILENFYWRELWRQVLLWVRMHWKNPGNDTFCEDEILKDWFADND